MLVLSRQPVLARGFQRNQATPRRGCYGMTPRGPAGMPGWTATPGSPGMEAARCPASRPDPGERPGHRVVRGDPPRRPSRGGGAGVRLPALAGPGTGRQRAGARGRRRQGGTGGLACPGGRRADLIRSARRGAAAARPGRVSRQVIWEAQAIDQAAGFLRDDPDGVREMLDAVARLADEPRPAGSFPYGSPDRRRLRIGRYRVMYDITAETVSVWHLGRDSAGS